jgi:hypothetical protein
MWQERFLQPQALSISKFGHGVHGGHLAQRTHRRAYFFQLVYFSAA